MDLQTILVSASVAGLVTLGIEYAAKPWLEARKEGILVLQRQRRELVAALRRAYMNLGMLNDLRQQHDVLGDSRVQDLVKGFQERVQADCVAIMRAVSEIPDERSSERTEVITCSAGMLEGNALFADALSEAEFSEVAVFAESAINLTEHPEDTRKGKRARELARHLLDGRAAKVQSIDPEVKDG